MEPPSPPEAAINLAKATVRGTFWTYASFYTGKLLVFLTTVILARLLVEEDFGVAGYALVVMTFLEVLNDMGVSPALIYYRKDPEATDTAFWLSQLIGIIMFLITFFGAPLVGAFFRDARAVPVTQALALTFPISSLGQTHDVLLRKQLSFGRKFVPDFAKALSKGIVSIILAWLGFGAWSLIIGQVVGRISATAALWWVMPWRPSRRFVVGWVKRLLSYGINIVSVDMLGMLINNIDYLFVGRFLGPSALGVYTVAFRFPDLLVMQFCDIISRVIFPVYSKMKDDPEALQKGFEATTRYVSLVTVPLGIGLALVSRPLVLAFFTEKWIEAVPVMQAISIYAVMLSLAYNAGDVYKAQGRPILLTQISSGRALVLAPALYWATQGPQTIVAVAWVHAVIAFISGIVEVGIASRILRTPLHKVVNALQPAFFSAAVMTAAVLASLFLLNAANPWLQLLVTIPLGVLVYLGVLWFFQRDLLISTLKILRSALAR